MYERDKQTLRRELATELDRILAFWMSQAADHEHGGYYGEISFDGQVIPNAPKGGILHARILWVFSAAYRQTGDPAYGEQATRAYEYLTEHFFDREHGGVFWEIAADGTVLNDRKQIYALAFAIYGLAEYARIQPGSNALTEAVKLYRAIEARSFDTRRNGYFEAFTRSWGYLEDVRLSDKDENAVKTMNTHLHIMEAYTNLYRVWPETSLRERIVNLLELFCGTFVQDDYHFGLFFDADWHLSSRNVSYGHDIEGSWLLWEAVEVIESKVLQEKLRPIVLNMAKATVEEGLSPRSAVKEELHVATGEQDPTRHWWPQVEGIVGFYNAYQLTRDEGYLALCTKIWSFIKEHLLDLQHGEWFHSVCEETGPNRNMPKVGFWKCPYHNSRACLETMARTEIPSS